MVAEQSSDLDAGVVVIHDPSDGSLQVFRPFGIGVGFSGAVTTDGSTVFATVGSGSSLQQVTVDLDGGAVGEAKVHDLSTGRARRPPASHRIPSRLG